MSDPAVVRAEPQVERCVRVLHLGCGRKGTAVPFIAPDERVTHLVTLDADPFLKPDLVCQLGEHSIALADNSIDVAVAVHVLEHIGRQGETGEWFAFWEDLYRVLAPSGEVRFESPMYDSVWCWADPSHARALSPQAFVFLAQDSYRIPESSISPYRIRCDFKIAQPFIGVPDGNPEIAAIEQVSHFRGVLRAVKPLRPWWEDSWPN